MAVERTALAWNRSGLAIAAIAGSIAKAGAEAGHARLAGMAAAVLLVAAAVVWAFGNFAYADRRRKGPLDRDLQRAALRLIWGVSLLSAAIAFPFALLT
jgi:uncharacterized membrane protein YidH (DUF202 family)